MALTADADAERIAELEQDNARLRRLLDQRDAPGELRHRLRGTLALLRAIIHQSSKTNRNLPGYTAHLEDRLDAIARAQSLADQHGEVDLRTLFADEMLRYGASEEEGLLLTGPEVRLRPKAGQIVALAIHELAVNAIEHGVLGAKGGQIRADWSIDAIGPEHSLTLVWSEIGTTPGLEPVHRGFGTAVLMHMLPYELAAVTQLSMNAQGWVCTIRLPLSEHVGRVVSG